jgi:3-deoxy-D-manno-octulosonic-acid transferase
MSLPYNISIAAYNAIVHLASPFNSKARLWANGRKGLMDKIRNSVPEGARPIWFHCASLGEFEQGRPIIEAIKKQHPDKKILLTFFSPSGYEIRKNYALADWVFYLPADTPANARAFTEAVNPAFAIFVKYEFWYNYISELDKKNIPLFVVSAIFREGQPFFKWYGGFFRKLLNKIRHLFVQDTNSLELLNTIGVRHASVLGDTRFDRVAETASKATSIEEVERFKGSAPLIISGSTWPEDETLLKSVLKSVPASYKMVIAPHEIGEGHLAQVKELFQDEGCIFFSEINSAANLHDRRVLIMNNIGMLSRLYQLGVVAYIGGGFGKGIHNTLEAAAFGIPVVFGPNYEKFREAKSLVERGGAFSVSNEGEAAVVFAALLKSPEKLKQAGSTAGKYVEENIGATHRFLEYLRSESLL